MKKVLIAVVALVGLLISSNETKAQTPVKFGFFDLETMVTVMPGYVQVDSLLQIYERDSLTAEYDMLQDQFQYLEDKLKKDSAEKKPESVLELTRQERNKVGMQLLYWQQIAQNKLQNKRNQLAGPLVQQVVVAYQKILQKGNYTLVFNPQALETISLSPGVTKIENLFIPVAKELKIQLPPDLGGGGDEPATKPKPKTN
jgi:Skp family chaperone for outer membrane proteins